MAEDQALGGGTPMRGRQTAGDHGVSTREAEAKDRQKRL
jgi:hypothetical protein